MYSMADRLSGSLHVVVNTDEVQDSIRPSCTPCPQSLPSPTSAVLWCGLPPDCPTVGCSSFPPCTAAVDAAAEQCCHGDVIINSSCYVCLLSDALVRPMALTTPAAHQLWVPFPCRFAHPRSKVRAKSLLNGVTWLCGQPQNIRSRWCWLIDGVAPSLPSPSRLMISSISEGPGSGQPRPTDKCMSDHCMPLTAKLS